jgi:hypothetical protein
MGILFICLLSSCRTKVAITQDYIYSTSWSRGEYQGFQIAKIRLTDTTLSVHSPNFNKYSLDKYTIDSNFCFGAGIDTSSNNTDRMPKIYFAREGKYHVWYKCFDIYKTYKTIGALPANNWYVVTGILPGTEDFFVYIDKDGSSYTYGLGPTNY